MFRYSSWLLMIKDAVTLSSLPAIDEKRHCVFDPAIIFVRLRCE